MDCGAPHQLVPEPNDWEYIEFHPELKPEFDGPVLDGAYELLWPGYGMNAASEYAMPATVGGLPSEEEKLRAEKALIRNKDLFVPHIDPEKGKTPWKFYGRTDDVIVLTNGGKLNPVSAELTILGHPEVSAALIVGERRACSALLIEPSKPRRGGTRDFVDTIWSSPCSGAMKVRFSTPFCAQTTGRSLEIPFRQRELQFCTYHQQSSKLLRRWYHNLRFR